MSGIPLALEQAGALIRDREFSFSEFNTVYKTKYRQIMEMHPQEGFWTYDKNRVITTILDMTYSSVTSNSEHAALLDFIGVLGSWQIPITLIEEFQFTNIDGTNPIERYLTRLENLFRNSNFLRLALRRLASLFLIKLKEEGGRIKNIMIHRVMCQWCIDNVISRHKESYVIQAAYGLANEILVPLATHHPAYDKRDQSIRRNYLAPLENCIRLIKIHVLQDQSIPHQGRFAEAYTIIASRAARAYLSLGSTEEATRYFNESIELDIIKASEECKQWPDSEMTLDLLSGLARAYKKASDLDKALEALGTAHILSERLYGPMNETTAAIVSRIKEVSARQQVAQRHHKSVVVASTDASAYRRASERIHQSSKLRNSIVEESLSSVSILQSIQDEGFEDLDLEGDAAANELQPMTAMRTW